MVPRQIVHSVGLVLVAVAVANRGRPNARMGGLAASDVEGVDGLR